MRISETEGEALVMAKEKQFEIEWSDETFSFRKERIADGKIVGTQIAEIANAYPIEDFAILRHLKTGELESIRPSELVDLEDPGVERFFIVKGPSNNRFTVEGRAMEWPQALLAAKHIKFLAHAQYDQVLVLDTDDGDVEFEDDAAVDLSSPAVERFKLRKMKKTVTVYYREAEFELERRKWSTEELLAAFSVPTGYKLDQISGDGEFHELKPGELVKVRDGMEFSSHPPVGQSS
ncbi:multiubiquitin domain-containing protein (plasmid) [Agrobacterium rosae]|uniref:multiubiquitin domain-containing protein n=1 Tax=Agrobacterium rosae TaxID=1972867 RepID=UPI002A0EB0EE|nr:multiubiquitin domain-containing protein [Agrobacterium rosae]MDX8316752.1 multiubiquitin domain-containing protein [Agrobacterium rosae]